MPATFELACGEPNSPIDVDAFEFEVLDDLAEELRERASACRDGLVVDFRPKTTPPPYSVPEAMTVLVREFAEAPASLTIQCLLANERARSVVVRCLPKSQRPSLLTRRGGIEIEIACGNIVDARVDAIVNASNTHLHLGGGVSGAIRAATRDPAIDECARLTFDAIDASSAKWPSLVNIVLYDLDDYETFVTLCEATSERA